MPKRKKLTKPYRFLVFFREGKVYFVPVGIPSFCQCNKCVGTFTDKLGYTWTAFNPYT